MRHGIAARAILLISLTAGPMLTLGGCSDSPSDSILAGLTQPKPGEVAREAFNVYDADKRRRSINLLSNAPWGGQAPYLKTYRLLVDDPDPTVRAACLRALGKHGDPTDVPAIAGYLKDKTSFVRWEAAKALQRLHNPVAIEPLTEALREDEEIDVRVAAANALAQYPDKRAFATLIGALQDPSYAVVNQAQHSLETLTGESFGQDGASWLAWSRNQGDQLFAGKETYYYPQFVPPPTFWQKMEFWHEPQKIVPQQPRGTEPSNPLFKKSDETVSSK